LHFYHQIQTPAGENKANEPQDDQRVILFPKLIIAINILEAKKGTTKS